MKRVIKAIIFISVLFMLACFFMGCGKDPVRRYLIMEGTSATSYHEGANPVLHGSIETSLVRDGSNVDLFFSAYKQEGAVYAKTSADPGGLGFPEYDYPMTMPYLVFQYTMKVGNTFYMFGLRDKDIYLITSTNGSTWTPANNGQPVLTHSSDMNSIYHNLWNVGVAVDDSGTWHMLVECAPKDDNTAQIGVGLAYLTASMSGTSINFDATKTNAMAIPNGGNPHVQNIPGKGIFSIYGVVYAPAGSFGSEWFLSAATLSGGVWTAHIDKFRIGDPGFHVSDASAVDLPNGGSMITMSHDQNDVWGVYSNKSLSEIYDSLL